MDLTQLASEPEVTIAIAGHDYRFSELPIASLARLQTWIRDHTPHPLDTLRGHVDGFAPEDRQALLEQARQEALSWPPQIGTPAGALALLGTEDGQIQTLFEAIAVHEPAITLDQAKRLYRRLKKGGKQAGDATVTRIFGVAFGLDIDDASAAPKSVTARLLPEPTPIDWAILFRRAEQRLRMRRWEILRYTLSQLTNALDQTDTNDPHAGGIPISSLAQLDDLCS